MTQLYHLEWSLHIGWSWSWLQLKIVIKLFFLQILLIWIIIVLLNFFDLIVVIVDGLVIKCHYKNYTETNIVYCQPVKRHPWVQRVQPLQCKWGHLISLQSLWPLWPSDQQCTSLQSSQTLTNPQYWGNNTQLSWASRPSLNTKEKCVQPWLLLYKVTSLYFL